MSFDKSLKVLNYARDNNGFVELFTELDHSFVAGDKVFIVGGIYDNTNELSYTSSYNNFTPTEFNPYAQFSAGYTIRTVNYPQNSFTIDLPSTPPLYYPHGVLNNIIGNPQDAINIAYNSYFPTPDLYKNVFVSRTAFINGRFKKGTIQNGIFGNDYHKVRLNIHENFAASAVQSDIQITHIAAKNVSISKCIISSKTDNQNPASLKMKVVEDGLINPGPNPFGITTVPVTANNDSWGYSVYEQFRIYDDSIIFNGDFNNPRDFFLEIENTTITRGKLGGKEPNGIDANILRYGGLQSGFIGNFTNIFGFSSLDIFNFGDNNQSTIDTFIDLKPISVAWGVNPGEVVFTVNYDVLANKDWTGPFFLNGCYISGIKPLLPPNNYPDYYDYGIRYDITQSYGSLISTTYTHGSINSAQIVLSIFNLIPYWASWIINFPTPVDFDFTNTRVSFLSLDNMWVSGNTNISTVSQSYGGNMYFAGSNVNVLEGMYMNITHDATTNFIGSDTGQSVLLIGTKQMFQSNATTNAIFNYVTIEHPATPIKGNFNNSRIFSGNIHNSTLNDTYVDIYSSQLSTYLGYLYAPNIYLYNDIITGNTIVPSYMQWDKIQYNGTSDYVYNDNINPPYIIESSFLGFRKTPWKTGPGSIAPITPNMPAPEFNKFEGTQSISYYNSQTVVETPFLISSQVPEYRLFYHVPSLQNIDFPIISAKYYSIIDHGDMYFGGVWQSDTNKKRSDVLFSGGLNSLDFNTPTLLQMITDRYSHNVIGATDKFPGVDPLFANISDIREVDINFQFELTNYWNGIRPRRQSDITINIHDIPTPVLGQPDPAYINNHNRFLKLTEVSLLTTIDNIYPGATSIPDGTYSLSFRHFGPVEEFCFFVPFVGIICVPVPTNDVVACFIEVERVIVTYYNAINDITQIEIHNCNYCPEVPGYAIGGTEYAWDILPPGIAYPQDFPILKSPYNPTNTIEINKYTGDIVGDHVDVTIEYWITWYNASPLLFSTSDNLPFTGFSGGFREKKIETYNFT